jgi:hypothetical protein
MGIALVESLFYTWTALHAKSHDVRVENGGAVVGGFHAEGY